jgi:cytochrome c5
MASFRRSTPFLRLALLFGLTAIATATAAAAEADPQSDPVDVSGMRPPRWQLDPELSQAWADFTGRYIYERACTGCHDWGPEHLGRDAWRRYLADFPDNHEPDVREEYLDLTAQFTPGKYVPDQEQQLDALSTFILGTAPDEATASSSGWSGLPRVGDPAPPFSIVDIDGREHTLETYRGSQRLVLVFSRAHW